MNRKHNPWVALVALILLAVVVVCICAGCTGITPEARIEKASAGRFSVEPIFETVNDHAYTVTDNDTGKEYLIIGIGPLSGMVEMED